MKLRRFLLALALVVCSTATAMAQGGAGGPMPAPPLNQDPQYDRGYHNGWNNGIHDARVDRWILHNHKNWNGQSSSYDHGYYDGYNATRGFVGPNNRYSDGMNGINTGSPLASALNGATNSQLAYEGELREKQWRAQTYLAARERYSSYRAQIEALHPHASPEELAALRNARLPAPLSKDEFDPAQGVIRWPGVLKRAEFDEGRTKLEGLFRQTADNPHSSGLGTQNYHDTEHAVNDMSDKLHSEIDEFEPDEYIAASKFLKRLLHQASMPPANPPPK